MSLTSIKILGMLLTLASSVVLARLLGAEEFGAYTYILAIISLLAIPSHGGVPTLIVRETAKLQAEEKWAKLKSLWGWSLKVNLMLSSLSIFILFLISGYLVIEKQVIEQEALIWGAILIPVLSLGMIKSSALRGLRIMVWGSLPEQVFIPSLLITGVVLYYFIDDGLVTSYQAIMSYVLSAFFTLVTSSYLLRRNEPLQISKTRTVKYNWKPWAISIVPLALISGLNVAYKNIGIILLGIFSTTVDVALYKVAFQASILISFSLGIINILMAPYIAILNAKKNYDKLQCLISIATVITFVLSIVIFFMFYFFGEKLLTLSFGIEYELSYFPLIVLAFGQVANTFFGSPGLVLNMTGNEKDALIGTVIGFVTNLLLSICLIPLFGLVGAVTAASFSLIIFNLILWKKAKEKTNINTAMSFRAFRAFRAFN